MIEVIVVLFLPKNRKYLQILVVCTLEMKICVNNKRREKNMERNLNKKNGKTIYFANICQVLFLPASLIFFLLDRIKTYKPCDI